MIKIIIYRIIKKNIFSKIKVHRWQFFNYFNSNRRHPKNLLCLQNLCPHISHRVHHLRGFPDRKIHLFWSYPWRFVQTVEFFRNLYEIARKIIILINILPLLFFFWYWRKFNLLFVPYHPYPAIKAGNLSHVRVHLSNELSCRLLFSKILHLSLFFSYEFFLI